MNLSRPASTLILSLTFSGLAVADDQAAAVYTDPARANADFQIQGEYIGALSQGKRWGGHVIADGKGLFRAIGYIGGLPGDGWSGEPGQYVSGKFESGVAKFHGEGFLVVVDGRSLKILNDGGVEIGRLKKLMRKSDTLAKSPPDGTLVLFEGTSVDNWEGGRIVEKCLLASNCRTRRSFGDHSLHIEFRIPFMPDSMRQDRGNSGVYIQSRYELQILDSFGLRAKDNGCGAVYRIRKPSINMCYPPLAWQTYDVDFTAAKWKGSEKVSNARMTVRHNGVVIHQNLDLPGHTPGRLQEAPGPAPLFLQSHGSPVVFRNIWVIEK